MTAQDLERMASAGCSACAEHHEHKHDEPLYLHSKCHIDAPFFLFRERAADDLVLRCCHRECSKVILRVHSGAMHDVQGSFGQAFAIFAQSCHPDSAVWASYAKGSKTVQIECYECKEVVMRIVLP